MAAPRTITKGFQGGEVSPEFFGAISDGKFQTGLARCRNFIVEPHGPISSRPGFHFVALCKDRGKKPVRLIPFVYNDEQSAVMETGEGYLRWHTLGQTMLAEGGSVLEVSTTYSADRLFKLRYEQSNDVVTLVDQAYPPAEVRRLGATQWSISPISFTPTLERPTSVIAVPTTATDPGTLTTQTYVVSRVVGVQESPTSLEAACQNNLFNTGAKNTISWSALAGEKFKVYKFQSGVFGFIGFATGTATGGRFVDDNISPDISTTPPIIDANVLGSANHWPQCVGYFEQRRWFGGTTETPQGLWGTRSGTESDLSYSIPTKATDAVIVRYPARRAARFNHLVSVDEMVAFTGANEYRITSVNADAISPDTISVKSQGASGANDVRPVVVGSTVLYAAARGSHLREMGYNAAAQRFVSADLMLRASHLLKGSKIVDMALQLTPRPVVWCVTSDGRLLGLTYVAEQQVGAWHVHDTDGTFESVCVVPEGDEDALYAVVRRQLNGEMMRVIERMDSAPKTSISDWVGVDCGYTYRGAPTTVVSGLSWLDGREVAILADGAVLPRQVVRSAQINLKRPASVVTVGLPYRCDAQGLPLSVEQVMAGAQGRPKNVTNCWLRVSQSSSIKLGMSFDRLTEYAQRHQEPLGSPPMPVTGEVELKPYGTWTDDAQWCLRQENPLPLTVLAISIEVQVGG